MFAITETDTIDYMQKNLFLRIKHKGGNINYLRTSLISKRFQGASLKAGVYGDHC